MFSAMLSTSVAAAIEVGSVLVAVGLRRCRSRGCRFLGGGFQSWRGKAARRFKKLNLRLVSVAKRARPGEVVNVT